MDVALYDKNRKMNIQHTHCFSGHFPGKLNFLE